MAASPELQALIAVAAPLWAGEAEVIRTYFESPDRTRESDLAWLRRQCKKEFWDSIHIIDNDRGMFLGPVEMLREAFPKIERGVDRHEVLELAESLCEEFAHYVAFADAYDAIRGGEGPAANPLAWKESEEWSENAELGRIRQAHRQDHGELGSRACRFTEGGYCGLFAEGMKLAGKGPANDAIAAASRVVFEDEFEHMLKGIAGLDREALAPEQWTLLGGLVAEQMRARIRMRNAQFGYPVGEARIREIFEGKIEPVVFDYERARLAA